MSALKVLFLGGTGTISSASAAGTPDVQLTRTVAAQTLYGA